MWTLATRRQHSRNHLRYETGLNCTWQMLTNQLRELEADGLIHREIYAQVPPKVEYSLTERGRSLEPVIGALKSWGEANLLGAQAARRSLSAGGVAETEGEPAPT